MEDEVQNPCINCYESVDVTVPHTVLSVVAQRVGGSSGGEIEVLTTWPLCPNCEGTNGAGLEKYVKLALS